MLDRSKGRVQTKCSPWSYGLWAEGGANNSTKSKSIMKTPESMEEDNGGDTQSCSTVKKRKKVKLSL
jgi:hypothetical protein